MAKCPGCGAYHYKGTFCPKCGVHMIKVERRYRPLNFEKELARAKPRFNAEGRR